LGKIFRNSVLTGIFGMKLEYLYDLLTKEKLAPRQGERVANLSLRRQKFIALFANARQFC
jgi:hypothetical protein